MGYGKLFPGSADRNGLGSEKSSRRQMRLLPREHGATVIWLSSLLLAIGMLPEQPSALGVFVFLAASVLALVIIGKLTSGSKVIIRLERNPILLPVVSGLLTLIVPLGHIVMVGPLSLPVLACWLVFLVYCSSGVVYTRDLVRSVLKETAPTWTSFVLSTIFIVIMVVTMSTLDWLSLAALAILVPFAVHRAVVLLLIQRGGSSRVERIRRVGFLQAGNLMAAAIILAVVSRL